MFVFGQEITGGQCPGCYQPLGMCTCVKWGNVSRGMAHGSWECHRCGKVHAPWKGSCDCRGGVTYEGASTEMSDYERRLILGSRQRDEYRLSMSPMRWEKVSAGFAQDEDEQVGNPGTKEAGDHHGQ